MKVPAGLVLCAALVLSAAASASVRDSYVAHPAPAGSKTLQLSGEVERYAVQAGRVSMIVRHGTCRRVSWMIATGGRSSQPVSCPARAAASARIAWSGKTRVELVAGSDDSPDRLLVNGAAGARSWPLPERAFHVDVDGETAIFSTRSSREVYAVDLASGRIALVGLTRRLDTPRLDSAGLVFRDNVFKRRERSGGTLMQFVPRSSLDAALRLVGSSLRVDGDIADLAMDGARVALAVRRWHGGCDAVVYWNIAWRYSIPITEDEERTCAWSRRGGKIQSVSLAGLRAAWVMRVGSEQRLVSASSVDCFERRVVTARTSEGERLLVHAGDSGLLAYLVQTRTGTVLGQLDSRMRGRAIAREELAPSLAAADGLRIALLRSDGSVLVRSKHGGVASTFQVGRARAIALRGRLLVALTRTGSLDVFDTGTGERLASWRAPAGARARIDAHFGVAVITTRAGVHAVSLATGRTAVVARAQAPVAAIEAPGIAYAESRGPGAGKVSFVPFSRIERLLSLGRTS